MGTGVEVSVHLNYPEVKKLLRNADNDERGRERGSQAFDAFVSLFGHVRRGQATGGSIGVSLLYSTSER